MPTPLTNQLLIALPALADGNFARSVTLVCQHDDDGAMGIMVNKASEYTLGDVLGQMGLILELFHHLGTDEFDGGQRGAVVVRDGCQQRVARGLQLRLFTLLMRWLVQPVVATSKDPAKARRGFRVMAWFFRVPPLVLHLVEAGWVHWISVRRRDSDWVILFLHGGGYITGSPVTHLGLVARIAKLTGVQVASVDYRLAPETPFPGARDDCYAALGWLHEQADALGIDPSRIAVGGESAGGGHAVALAEKKGCDLAELSLEELQGINAAITADVFNVLTVEASVASRKSFGGTAPSEVRKQIAWWRARN